MAATRQAIGKVEAPSEGLNIAAGLPAVAPTEARREGGSNSVVESQPSKLLVAGSIPVSRSNLRSLRELRLASQVIGASYGWASS
jgi:hypothetical protein